MRARGVVGGILVAVRRFPLQPVESVYQSRLVFFDFLHAGCPFDLVYYFQLYQAGARDAGGTAGEGNLFAAWRVAGGQRASAAHDAA